MLEQETKNQLTCDSRKNDIHFLGAPISSLKLTDLSHGFFFGDELFGLILGL